MSNREGTHKPPSRLRYEATHPTITVRVSLETRQRIMDIARTTGKSVGDILREAMDVQEASAGTAYEKGYEDAKARYAVTWKCWACGEDVTAEDEKSRKMAGQHFVELGAIHFECAKKMYRDGRDITLGSYSKIGPSGVPTKTRIVHQRPDGTTYSTPA